MRIAERLHEFPGLKPAFVCDEMGQERVARDVEGHAEEEIGAALVELAAQAAIEHEELEERVAGRERLGLHVRRVPG